MLPSGKALKPTFVDQKLVRQQPLWTRIWGSARGFLDQDLGSGVWTMICRLCAIPFALILHAVTVMVVRSSPSAMLQATYDS